MDQKFLCDFYRMTGKKFKRNVISRIFSIRRDETT